MFCYEIITDIMQVQNMYFEFKSNNYKLLQVYIKTQEIIIIIIKIKVHLIKHPLLGGAIQRRCTNNM